MEKIYEPAIISAFIGALSFCFQLGLFVRPEQLEKKHRQILDEAEKKFASISLFNELKSQTGEIKHKIDQIYDMLLNKSR